MYEPKNILLKKIPEDVYEEIQRVQYEEKKKRKRQYSLVQAIFDIVRNNTKNQNQ